MSKKKKDSGFESRIMDAATDLFLTKGFKGTSTTEIAQAAGCNQALVHYYFRTKARLFDSIFESKLKLFLSLFFEIGESEGSFEEKMRRRIEAHFDILAANPKLPHLLLHELNSNPDRLESLKEHIGTQPQAAMEQLGKELQTAVSAGEIRPITPLDLILTIISLNVSLFLIGPIFQTVSNLSKEEYQELLNRRKKENVTLILQRLRL